MHDGFAFALTSGRIEVGGMVGKDHGWGGGRAGEGCSYMVTPYFAGELWLPETCR